MTQELEVVTMHGDYLIDSRLLAARLGYDHKIMLQSLRRHKARLEAKSVLLQIEAKPPRGSLGGRPELYYMLNERQCLILAGSLKKGIEADEWHDKLVDAFLRERQKARALEVQLQAPVSSAHSLTDTFWPRALENLHRVPDGYFSVMGELFKHFYNLEALFNRSLDEHLRASLPDNGAGSCTEVGWCVWGTITFCSQFCSMLSQKEGIKSLVI